VVRAAAAHPDRVVGVVELGWMIGAPVARVPLVLRLAGVPLVGRVLAAVPPNEAAVRAIFRSVGLGGALASGRVSQEALDCYRSLLRDTDTMRNEIRAGPRVILPVRGMNDRVLLSDALLASIRTPTYFLWGEDDPLGGADIARSFVARVPSAQLELLPDAGHAVWIDAPDHAAATVDRFLGS
jgi:pimeloyl-ACP methyl ester carboxylesterase